MSTRPITDTWIVAVLNKAAVPMGVLVSESLLSIPLGVHLGANGWITW